MFPPFANLNFVLTAYKTTGEGGIWSHGALLRTHTLNLLSSISNQGFSETDIRMKQVKTSIMLEKHTLLFP